MKIYVASAFGNKTQVRLVQQLLQERGHVITHDWTVCDDTTGVEAGDLDAYRAACALGDYLGVVSCDTLVVLNDRLGFGMATEYGLALAYGKNIVVVNPAARMNIFYHLTANPNGGMHKLVPDVTSALEVVKELQDQMTNKRMAYFDLVG